MRYIDLCTWIEEKQTTTDTFVIKEYERIVSERDQAPNKQAVTKLQKNQRIFTRDRHRLQFWVGKYRYFPTNPQTQFSMTKKSYLDLVNDCDNFPYFDDLQTQKQGLSAYYRFKLDGIASTLGFIPVEIALKFPPSEHWDCNDLTRELIFRPQGVPSDPVKALAHRNQVLATYLKDLRQKKVFEVLAGWRNEEYPIFGPKRQLILSMERSATPLFGVLTYGIHLTAYVKTPEGMKLWTPKRSETKQTYPGMMDNTVAGGLSTYEIPYECMIREAMEEASLSEEIAKRAEPRGTLTYQYLRGPQAGGEVGLSQPECQYIYDLELPADIIPSPNDNEAVDYQALTIDEVKEALAAGKFKTNCAMLVVDFFVRHGILTPENEPDYIEIVSRLHRRLPYPTK